MAKYTRAQIEVMARAAGWGARARDASWVAMAESSGDARVVNEIQCVGLMQVNHSVFVDQHPTWTIEWLQDPMNNLKAAKVIFKNAANSFAEPWADSREKGGIPGGWGPHVSAKYGGTAGGSTDSDVSQAEDNPCAGLKGPAKEYCLRSLEDQAYPDNGQSDGLGILDAAEQIGRLAQAVAKAGNWLANPANWVRVVYVAGGGLLALTAVSVIVAPGARTAYGQVRGAIPVTTVKTLVRKRRANVAASREAAASEE